MIFRRHKNIDDFVIIFFENPSKSFGDQIETWDSKLSTCDAVLNNFCEVQRRWLYLEPVFCRGVFPSEKARFSSIDQGEFLNYL